MGRSGLWTSFQARERGRHQSPARGTNPADLIDLSSGHNKFESRKVRYHRSNAIELLKRSIIFGWLESKESIE
jgi:hypothetical protein